jgi:hypothetical protein
MQTIIFIAIILTSFEVDTWLDSVKTTRDKTSPLHGKEAAIMCGIYSVLSLLFFGFTWLAVKIFALVLFTRWPYFNIRINNKLGRRWYEIGKTATLDKFLKTLPYMYVSQYVLQAILIAITILTITYNL